MKALTVLQPWAELIARGGDPAHRPYENEPKRVENRTWETKFRGRLYIHAGKSTEGIKTHCPEPGAWEVCTETNLLVEDLALGAVIALVTLVDCLRIEEIKRGDHDARFPWIREHRHSLGPWCWVLEDVKRFKPIHFRGRQGLFDIDPNFLERCRREQYGDES